MRSVLLIFSLFFFLHAMDCTLSQEKIANGKTLFLSMTLQKDEVLQKVLMDKQEFPFFTSSQNNHGMYAFLPLSYYETPKKKTLTLLYTQKKVAKTKEITFDVVDGMYAKEELKVSQNKVTPNKSESSRASKEYAEAMQIYNHVSKQSYIETPFVMPMQSAITSDFGRVRVYNGSLKGFHSGTDFRASVGTPIFASNDGVIALVSDRFYSGGTVIIDHGHGVYTCYFHMSQFYVKEGERVAKGTTLGLSGKSGRVTGPHLHFAVRVNGVQVDPLQFIELMNQHLLKET